jgi:hypothetical protein
VTVLDIDVALSLWSSRFSLILAGLTAALVPVRGQKPELKFDFLAAKARERPESIDRATLTPVLKNAGLMSNVIGAIVRK